MKQLLLVLICLSMLSGCAQKVPKEALQLSPENLQERQMQTRRFETTDKATMLAAATGVLQDLGFTLEESEVPLGVLVGSKTRDATSGAQIAGAIFLAFFSGSNVPIDSHQLIRVSLVMRPLSGSTSVSKETSPVLSAADMNSIQNSLERSLRTSLQKKYSKDVSRRVAEQVAENARKSIQEDVNRQLATTPKKESVKGDSLVRVTFQRQIYNTSGQITLAEQIKEPELYQQFYEKLSKSVFLEAHLVQ